LKEYKKNTIFESINAVPIEYKRPVNPARLKVARAIAKVKGVKYLTSFPNIVELSQ
jgi:hypothetical protein